MSKTRNMLNLYEVGMAIAAKAVHEDRYCALARPHFARV
jgi:hypothetical protein